MKKNTLRRRILKHMKKKKQNTLLNLDGLSRDEDYFAIPWCRDDWRDTARVVELVDWCRDNRYMLKFLKREECIQEEYDPFEKLTYLAFIKFTS